MSPIMTASPEIAGGDCPFEARLSAFHDGELDAEMAHRVAGHVPQCAVCSETLSGIRAVSRLLNEPTNGRMSQIGMSRLHATADAAVNDLRQQQEVFPLARSLIAAAASVLIIAGAWLVEAPTPRARGTGGGVAMHARPEVEWERLASVGKLAAPQGSDSETGFAFSTWMLKSLKEKAKGS